MKRAIVNRPGSGALRLYGRNLTRADPPPSALDSFKIFPKMRWNFSFLPAEVLRILTTSSWSVDKMESVCVCVGGWGGNGVERSLQILYP